MTGSDRPGHRETRLAAKARILAIDPQQYFRSFLEGLLSEEGYEVQSAENGVQGLARLEQNGPFDLVITDLTLPDREGIHSVAAVRRAAPDLAILVLTAVSDVRSVVEAMRQGASDYLQKPIDRETLLQAIDSVLGQHRVRNESARLVDENLEFMSRLSLHERSLPLLGGSDLEASANGVLQLLAVEAGAPDGALWSVDPHGQVMTLRATCGEGSADADTLSWKTRDEQLDQRVQRGELVQLPERDGRAGAIFVPFVSDGRLLGVARLQGGPAAPGGAVDTGQRIGTVALANALRAASLAGGSLEDPLTGLPTRAYLERVLETEVNKADRFGRRLSCLCLEFRGLGDAPDSLRDAVVDAMVRTLRRTDVLCSEGGRRFWTLVTDTDSLGGVVLKRRMAERVGDALRAQGSDLTFSLGVASYPLDGGTSGRLIERALERVDTERVSLVHELGIGFESSLEDIGRRLLESAELQPAQLVPDAAELLLGELTCRPHDRGLLFLAPGPDAAVVLPPLAALGDSDVATEIFLASDSDTIPASSAVTAVGLPDVVSEKDTWMVRFGEAPPYALLAGRPDKQGRRPVFHTSDPVLVEHLTFQLRSEVGFGVQG